MPTASRIFFRIISGNRARFSRLPPYWSVRWLVTGGEEFGGHLAAVAQMDGGHVKAQEFQDLALLGIALGHLRHGLLIQSGHRLPGGLVIGLKVLRGGVEEGLHGVVELDELQGALVHRAAAPEDGVLVAGHEEAHAGDGVVEVNGVGELEQVVLALGVVEVEVGGSGGPSVSMGMCLSWLKSLMPMVVTMAAPDWARLA